MINYVDFRYSKDKGRVKAGDVFNSALNMGPSDTFYTDNLVDHQVIVGEGKASGNSVNLGWYPIIMKSVTLESDTTIAVLDDNNSFTIDGITGTVYESGLIKFTTPGTATKDLTITYRFDNESVRSDGLQYATDDGNGNGFLISQGAAGFTNVNSFASLYGNIH